EALLNFNAGGFAAAHAQAIAADLELKRASERSLPDHCHLHAWRQPHFHEADGNLVKAAHLADGRLRTQGQLRQRFHPLPPTRTSTLKTSPCRKQSFCPATRMMQGLPACTISTVWPVRRPNSCRRRMSAG